MALFLGATFFLLGAVIASFSGVVAGRLYTGQGIAHGRSRCDACGALLGPFDLIPLVSYVASRGRSRCCGARLSPVAPLSELLLGAVFLFAYLSHGLSLALPAYLLAYTLLAILVLYDFAHQILPPPLLFAFLACALIAGYLGSPDFGTLRFSAIAAFGFALFFAALWAASGGHAMGLADAPLVAGLAFMGGTTALMGFLFSFWIGALVGIVLLARAKRGARMGIEVPFAPFLAAGFLLAYFTKWDPFSLTDALAALSFAVSR